MSISDAARRWGVGRETIYRRHRSGELSFVTAAPPTVDPTEMVRVFGEPWPKPDKASSGDVATKVRIVAERDTLKAVGASLMAELAAAKKELNGERVDARRELEPRLDILVGQQWLDESPAVPRTLAAKPPAAPPTLLAKFMEWRKQR